MTAFAGDSGTAATRQRTEAQGERYGGQAGRRVTVRDVPNSELIRIVWESDDE